MDDRNFRARRAILIAGPTASGKSAVALALAEKLGGTVINADAMQVYADLAILTARPSAADHDRASHSLFGHVDAAEPYSVGCWLRDVAAALDATWAADQVPVLVGGTGLYLKAMMQGLSAIPPVPEAVRTRIRAEAADVSTAMLHGRLAAMDPVMAARLRPTDPQRIVRALEVFAATGRSMRSFQDARDVPLLPPARVVGVFLAPERQALNARIELRFDAMMAAGALGEVEALAARDLDPAVPAMRALGVPPLLAHLRDEMPIDEAVARGKLLTRHYAKRQLTFARHQLPGLAWVPPDEALVQVTKSWTGNA